MENQLFIACKNNNFELCEILLKNGVNVNITNKHNETLAHVLFTIDYPDVNILQLLIDNGIDLNTKTIYEDTPLHLACSNNKLSEEIIVLLLQHVDLNVRDIYDDTPLYIALHVKNYKMVHYLLYCDVYIEDKIIENKEMNNFINDYKLLSLQYVSEDVLQSYIGIIMDVSEYI